MNIQFYLTTSEAAELLSEQLKQKVHYYDLNNLLRARSIKSPEKIGGRRLWSHDDLKRAAKALRIRRAKRPVLTEQRSRINKGEES